MSNLLIAVIGVGLVALWLKSSFARRSLQSKLSVVESTQLLNYDKINQLEKKLNSKFTDEQLEFKDKLEQQYVLLFDELKEEIKTAVAVSKEGVIEAIKKAEAAFADKLAKAYEEAVEKIKFDEIVYKKTITKKRKEFSRKNGKDAKPQQTWRYIDED